MKIPEWGGETFRFTRSVASHHRWNSEVSFITTNAIPIPSMYGRFTYIWLIFYGFHVGKYTSPMDGMGIVKFLAFCHLLPIIPEEFRPVVQTSQVTTCDVQNLVNNGR